MKDKMRRVLIVPFAGDHSNFSITISNFDLMPAPTLNPNDN